MPRNKIDDLRNHLFDVIERLKNNSDPEAEECEKIPIEDANAIKDVADSIIESAKVEVQYMKAMGITRSNFLPDPIEQKTLNGKPQTSEA